MAETFDLRESFATERILLNITGFYPSRDDKINYFTVFRGVLMGSLAILMLLSTIGLFLSDYEDLSELTEMLLLGSTHISFLCKLFNFILNRKNIIRLENILGNSIYKNFNEEQLCVYNQYIGNVKTVAKIFRVTCALVVLFYLIYSLTAAGNKLPFPGIFPWNVDDYYYLCVGIQMIMIGNSAYNNSSLDILTVMFISIGSAHFNVLRNNLNQIVYGKNKSDTKMEFVKNIKFHQETLIYVEVLENTFSNGLFIQFLATVFVLCFTFFQLMLVEIGTNQFNLLIVYLLCMLCQISMYCWYGHEIFLQSMELSRSAYMANWYEADNDLKKMILLFMERTKKPVVLTAGKFFTLSLTTLTGLLRSSYSYFAVLQRIYK